MKEYGTDPELDYLVNSRYLDDRLKAAKQGYGLDKLVSDENYEVREAVARQGYRLDKLVNDEASVVRCAVAEQGYRLDILICDKDKAIRKIVNNYLREHNYKTVFNWAEENNINLDIDEWLNSDDYTKRRVVAYYGYRLDKLINDKNWEVRAIIANIGYGLDKLLNDKDYKVRCEVARQGYGLDILVNDENESVRGAVADQGYGLDKLINDEANIVHLYIDDYLKEHNYKSVFDWAKDNNVDLNLNEWLEGNENQRYEVAKQGYRLDKLINDENECVRAAVAEQGYGLDKLVNDENYWVREAVEDYLKKYKLTLNKWCEQNGKETLKVNKELQDFVYKVEDFSKIKIETSYDSVDEFFDDTSNESYENKESITIVAVDTKVPLIKLEKIKNKNKKAFKFIVDISNNEDNFNIKSIFDTKEKFDQLLQSTINSLHEYSQFSKYADELEQCL